MTKESTYWRRRGLGLCTDCGGPKETPVGIRCQSCRESAAKKEKRRAWAKRYRETIFGKKKPPVSLFPERGLLEAPSPPKERPAYVFNRRGDELAHLRLPNED